MTMMSYCWVHSYYMYRPNDTKDNLSNEFNLVLKDNQMSMNKGNSSIPLFKTHKSIEKTNPGYKLKLRETH